VVGATTESATELTRKVVEPIDEPVSIMPSDVEGPPSSITPLGEVKMEHKSILVVDDHPVVRDGLSSMFAGNPEFTVVGEAADGAEAVRLAETLAPDVILMDLKMPLMDGVEATRRLQIERPGLPVIAISGHDYEERVLEIL